MLGRSKYVLSLAPDAARLVLLQSGMQWLGLPSAILDKWSMPAPLMEGGTSSSFAWASALSAAQSLINNVKQNSQFRIVLSNHFVRYKLIPALPPFLPKAEAINIARQCFRDLYGDTVDTWSIQVNPLPHGESVMIVAIDQALLDQLQSLCKAASINLVSVQPYFMTGFNAYRTKMTATSYCFAQVELARVTVALVQNNTWLSISSAALQSQPELQLLGLLKRELLLAGWDDQAITVYLPSEHAHTAFAHSRFQALEKPSHWRIEVLHQALPKGYVPHVDQVYAMSGLSL